MVRKASQPEGCPKCEKCGDDELCAQCWMDRDIEENPDLYRAFAGEDN